MTRFNYALLCGAAAGPVAVPVYVAPRLDEQLEAAAARHVAQVVYVSRLYLLYVYVSTSLLLSRPRHVYLHHLRHVYNHHQRHRYRRRHHLHHNK